MATTAYGAEVDRDSAREALIEYWEAIRAGERLRPHDPVLGCNDDGEVEWCSGLTCGAPIMISLDVVEAYVMGDGLPADIERAAEDFADAFCSWIADEDQD